MDLGNLLEGSGRGAESQLSRSVSHPQVTSSLRPSESITSPIYNDDSAVGAGGRFVAQAATQSSPGDSWAGAISRLQTQVSLHADMLESHRRQVSGVEQAVVRLQQEMSQVMHVLQEVRGDIQANAASMLQGRQVASDLDLLATQVAAVSRKAHEVDGAKIQLDLISNHLRRLEDQSLSSARSGTIASVRDSLDPIVVPPQYSAAIPTTLPPMRTVPPTVDSPRPRAMAMPPIISSQTYSPQLQRRDRAMSASDSSRYPQPGLPSFRRAEQTAGTTLPMMWTEGSSVGAGLPLPPPPPPSQQSPAFLVGQYQDPAVGIDPQDSGWAAVNQPVKRSFDEQEISGYTQAGLVQGSPKRPRLAPIIPKNYNDSYVQSPVAIQPAARGQAVESFYGRSRSQSDISRPRSQGFQTSMPVPPGVYRFVPSSTDADGRPTWQAESDQAYTVHDSPPSTSRSRGRSGRGRGSGRGRSVKSDSTHSLEDRHEISGSSHGRSGWTTGIEESFYDPVQSVRVGVPITSSEHSEQRDYPATPVSGTGQDAFLAQADMLIGSSGKKSRTKPIRNADGILIRKDGRPDMRSVSSANNLRKVHAKREAGRAEGELSAPRSARSLAPAYSNSGSSEDPERRSGSSHSDTPSSPARTRDRDEQETEQNAVMGRRAAHSEQESIRDNPGSVEPDVGVSRSANQPVDEDTVMRDADVAPNEQRSESRLEPIIEQHTGELEAEGQGPNESTPAQAAEQRIDEEL